MTIPHFNRNHLLFVIIFLEGYVVLATELLSIRLLIPFVGSGTEVISIIISAVLLPLAFGYHRGGNITLRHRAQCVHSRKKPLSIRKILIKNLFSSLIILTFGLSYLVQEMFFYILEVSGIHSNVLQTAIFSLLFLVCPTFMLAQTVPLISHYFAKQQLSQMTGKMLCFSTTGSFFGSVFTTIVLMMTIGVHNTVIFVLSLITGMIFLLDKKNDHFSHIMALFLLGIGYILLGIGYILNHSATMHALGMVSNNAYNMVQVINNRELGRIFMVNRSISSLLPKDPDKQFQYISHIERQMIAPLKGQHKKILVIGAGGFSIGSDDTTNDYIALNI